MASPKNSRTALRPIKSGPALAPKAKKAGGGTAAAGGTNFQAIVTAIASVHLLSGKPLGWLFGMADDTPTGIWSESEGPGDDLRIELADGRGVEIQAKKGLQKGKALWEALDALALGLAHGHLDFGVLAVASDSSGTIRHLLAHDIERIGQGREDTLSDIGEDWLARLTAAGLDARTICSRLRIQVVHGLASEDADRRLAKNLLASICADAAQADRAWKVLFEDAVAMMQQRGRADMPRLARLLASNGIALSANDDAAGVASRIANWVVATRNGFTLSATRKRLPLSALLDMRVVQIPFELPPAENAHKALARYHDGSLGHSRDDKEYDAEWTGRFRRRGVIQAGPGLGKSTLATRLAYEYALDGFPVLHVSLKRLAAAMACGQSFNSALKALGLDSSGVAVETFDRARLSDIVVIADGLDDCGPQHEAVAAGLHAYSIAYPRARIIVTTRPIGYSTTQLSKWQHYRLIAPSSTSGTTNLGRLIDALAEDSPPEDPFGLARRELDRTPNANAISVSPLALGMAASLLHRQGHLPETRTKLYEQLIALFESGSKVVRPEMLSAPTAAYVLNVLGWAVVGDPLVPKASLVDRCAGALAQALGVTKLTAAGAVEAALGYWERAGLIEAVHHDSLEMLTFVHKTFAEFVAARYVVGLEQVERDRELARIIELPDWTEVTTFASGLGYGNDIARRFLARGITGYEGQVERALRTAIDPDARIDDMIAQDLVEMAFTSIGADIARKFAIGVSVMKLAECRPAVVAPLAAARLRDEDFATRLTAWAATVAAGKDHFEPDGLEGALASLLPQIGSRFSKGGRFSLKACHDHELIGPIGVAALEAQCPDAMEAFAKQYLWHEAFTRTSIQARIDSILLAQSVNYRVSRDLESTSRSLMDRLLNPPEEECRAHNKALKALAAAVALDDSDPRPKPDYPPERFLQFAGYYSLSCFGQVEDEDKMTWAEPYDESSVAAAMSALVAISTVDAAVLAAEAREVVRFLDREPKAKPYALHFPNVDIPSANWDDAAALSLDKAKIEVAVRHGSKWLAFVAGNLLVAGEILEADVRRILAGAGGASLWAGVEIALEKLPTSTAIKVLLERLTSPLPKGAEYLYRGLQRLKPPMTDELGAAMALGLDDRYVSTVTQAAKLGLELVQRSEKLDLAPVVRAYADWQAHEREKKDKHAQWPSPLETLLKLRIALGGLDDDALATALCDGRSDVRKIAEQERDRRAASQCGRSITSHPEMGFLVI